jgi:hypothetical protein
VAVTDDFRVSFRVSRSIGRELNSADIQLYNLSQDTRTRIIDDGEVVQIEAGYSGNTEILAVAGITRTLVNRQPPDTILKIECQDGANELTNRKINLSFEAGATVSTVLDAVASELALGRIATGVVVSGTYQEGVAFSGKASDILDSVTRKGGVEWSIQDGSLQLLEPGKARQGRGVLVTPQTGLVRSPEPLDDPEGKPNEGGSKGYKIRTLLNPKIAPGERLVLESAEVPRTELLIDSVEHVGDTRGQDWYTEATLYEES